MLVNEVISRLSELGAVKSLAHSDKTEIERLYTEVLGKKFVKTSCSDCYHDAVIEMFLYLRKHGKMKDKCSYVLKNGALLQMKFGSGEMYTNANLTDEVAERYLAANPSGRVLFASMPEDWADRVSSRSDGTAEEIIDKAVELLDAGESVDGVKTKLKNGMQSGKRIRVKALNAYIKEAQKRLEE